MTVKVEGSVPEAWDSQTANHISRRFQKLERALAGPSQAFLSPSVPGFGPGTVPGGGGSTGGGGTTFVGVTDHGLLTGLEDDDHPQYVEQGDAVKAHPHGPFDVTGLETRFLERHEHPFTPHTHGPQDIVGFQQAQRPENKPHVHTVSDVVDIHVDASLVLMSRIFGG